jgi:hypothetical protein
MEKLFILYDGRAKTGDTDKASVFVTAGSEAEARHDGLHVWSEYDAVWYQYDCEPAEDGLGTLTNEIMRPDLPPFSEV